jgi:ATP-dependent DNA helicase RecG
MVLTLEQLQELMTDIESDRIERTVSVDKTHKFSEAVCAFANDFPNHRLPGYLLLGIEDDGISSGLQVSDQLLQNLAALRSDGNIQPLPAMTVRRYILPSQHEIAVVEVFPSDLPPVRYKGQVWIRVGPRRAIASETEERMLLERRGATAKHFDARPCLESGLEDLSLDRFCLNYLPNAVAIDIIKENHRDTKEQLASLRFYDLKRDCPTNAGILLFGEDPTRWIPGAYIQFTRFNGTQLTDEVATEQQVAGDLLTVLQSLDNLLQLHNQHYSSMETALQEQTYFLYPPIALRELLMNAVMHRWYEESTAPIRFYWFTDHIEIQSPGGLYGEATPENFPRQTSYRNPVLAEAMKTLGYVNKFGSGVLRAQQALAKNGHPPAEFQFEANYFLTIIRGIGK